MKQTAKNPSYMTAVKKWKVTYHLNGTNTEKYLLCNKFDLLKHVKSWYQERNANNDSGYLEFEEVPDTPKPLTSLFLDKDKREALCTLMKEIKAKYKFYYERAKGDANAQGLITSNEMYKRVQIRRFAEDMFNSLQNEFYMTADVCWNSIWRYQDEFKDFESSGYLLRIIPEKLLPWTLKLKENYHRDWTIEVLKLIKEFNLDNQPQDYSQSFMNDFMAVRNHQQFCSALLKWTDLIRWSPEKLSLLDGTYVQPANVHYEDEYNPDVDSDYILD